MTYHTPLNELSFTTVRIETARQSSMQTGTGFFFDYQFGQLNARFLVTNRHLVEEADHGKFWITLRQDQKPITNRHHMVEMSKFARYWFFHPDEQVDVAILPFYRVMTRLKQRGVSLYYKTITQSLIASKHQQQAIPAMAEVVFFGYPDALYDPNTHQPIAKRGMVASPIHMNYQSKPVFLVDASILPGSGGSPVFLYPQELHNGHTCKPPYFLGILASNFIRSSTGRIQITPIPSLLSSEQAVPQTLNLGIVNRANTIIEAIAHLMKKLKLSK